MHISLGVAILPVFWELWGCIFHWGSLYSQCFGDSGDAYFTRDPYTSDILGTPGMHISLGVPILLVFWMHRNLI